MARDPDREATRETPETHQPDEADRDAARVREPDTSERDARTTNTDLAEALLEAGVDNGVDDADTPDVAQNETVSKKKTTKQQTVVLLAAIERGLSPREAASEAGIHLRTAYGLLHRYEVDLDALQASTRKIMAMEALDRLDDWRLAAAVGASKRGNHLPAKDWLLHAGIIDPLQGEHQAGIRIAINIGTDDRPMKIVSPLAQNEEE